MDLPSKKADNAALQQADEIKALSAIFGNEFQLEKNNAFQIKIYSNSENEVLFQVTYPETYPLTPPHCQLSAPWMNRQAKQRLAAEIENIYSKNRGECIIHMCVETIKSYIKDQTEKEEETSSKLSDDLLPCSSKAILPTIAHGESLVLKKSVFQGHLAKIVSESQVQLVIDKLKENKKIASAKHNVYAYRISLENGRFIEDCDDDKEARAGSVLLRLLQIKNVSNVLIVVTRWYGGIQLGSDRFKLYSNAAGNLISARIKNNLTKNEVGARRSKISKKSKKK